MKVISQYTGTVTRSVIVDGVPTTETFSTVNDIGLRTETVGGVTKTYISVSEGKDAYGIIIADAIRTLVGELQLDLGRGIDYENTVWLNSRKKTEWERQVLARVLGYDFVESVIGFRTWMEGQTLRYELTVKTVDGIVKIAS